MSKEQVKEFFVKLEQDKKLLADFNAEMEKLEQSPEEVVGAKLIELGKANGFEFNMDDLKAAREDLMDQSNENSELDDSSLKAVAGGFSSKGEALLTSITSAGISCAIMSVFYESQKKGQCKQELTITGSQC